ncbi:MAG: hypothetical protein AABZ56_05185 [Bacteroidota bacterium]
MFSSLFYIIILFIQTVYAESNFRYNQQIGRINSLVSHGNYIEAYQNIRSLEQKSIFTINDLTRMRRNLALKVHANNLDVDYKPRTLNEYVVRSLSHYQNKEFSHSLSFCRSIIVEKPIVSDSMIKLFEIIAEQVPDEKRVNPLNNQLNSVKNLRLNEALNLLDLMKRKEKTLF